MGGLHCSETLCKLEHAARSATDLDRDVIKEKLVKAEEGLAAEGDASKADADAADASRAAASQGASPCMLCLPHLGGCLVQQS